MKTKLWFYEVFVTIDQSSDPKVDHVTHSELPVSVATELNDKKDPQLTDSRTQVLDSTLNWI